MLTGKPFRVAWMGVAPLLAGALVLSGCQNNAATTAENPTATTGAPSTETAAGPIQFSSDQEEAIATAGREDKIVMLDVYTDWCTWCHKLDDEVYSNQQVAAEVRKDFVALKVNPEKTDADRAFVEKYGVEGYPTILFLNGKGEEVHRVVGYVPAKDFIKEMETARAKAKATA